MILLQDLERGQLLAIQQPMLDVLNKRKNKKTKAKAFVFLLLFDI
jgi:hypothetical protein